MKRKATSVRARAVAAAAAGALVLAACGGGADADSSTDVGSASAEDAGGAETTLTWQMWSGSEVETQALEDLAAMVTEEHPNIHLEIQTATFPDYWTRIAAQASGGDVGCILGVQAARAAGIDGLMLPLTDERLSGAGIDLADFDPTIVEALRLDGELVAVPYDLGPLVVFYNVDAFEAAGLEPPAIDWSQEDFDAAARAMSGDGSGGYVIAPLIDTFMAWSLAREGVQPVSDDGELQITDPGLVATVEYLAGLQEEGVIAQLPATTDPFYAMNEFVSGSAAMVVDGPWQLGFVREEAGFASGIVPMPVSPGGAGAPVNGSGWGVSAGCEHPEEALQAVSVLTGPDALQHLAELGRAYPSRTAQQDSWFDGEYADAEEVLTAALQDAEPFRATADWTQVNTLFSQYSVQAYNGQLDAEEFLSTVQDQAG